MTTLMIPCTMREAFTPELVAPAAPSWWVRLARRIADGRRARRAMRELRGLDDRMLRDLGLGRSGIEYVVWHGRD
jgi:uncharacterized protein YjiS (DUF1127 family)